MSARQWRSVREPRSDNSGPLTVNVRGFVAVILAGVLAGSELTSLAMVHPTLWKLDHRAQVHAEKLMYRRFGTIDPFLMTATVVACFVAVGAFSGGRATMVLAGAACFAGMLTITLVGNMPINLKVLRWDEERGDPDEWRRIRRRWDRLHRVRIPLDVAGFLLVALALTTS